MGSLASRTPSRGSTVRRAWQVGDLSVQPALLPVPLPWTVPLLTAMPASPSYQVRQMALSTHPSHDRDPLSLAQGEGVRG